MAGTPYIRFFGDDWLSGTQSLTLEERGVLITLVALTATAGEAPVYDAERLARRLGCTRAKTIKLMNALCETGKITIEDGRIYQPRALKETKKAQENSEKQTKIANARWSRSDVKANENKPSADATALPRECQPEPEPELYSRVVLERARCFESAGLTEADAMNVPGLVSTVDIERLLRDPKHPCDFEMDVIPAIQQCAASLRKKGETLTNWSYCHAAILRNRDKRLAGNPAPTEQPASPHGTPARNQKHAGSGTAAAGKRLITKLREARGVNDGLGGEAEPRPAGGMGEVFSNHRRIAGSG